MDNSEAQDSLEGFSFLMQHMSGVSKKDKIALVSLLHTNNPEQAEALVDRAESKEK